MPNVLSAHTRRKNAVAKTVVIATDKLEFALVLTDGPEVPAPTVPERTPLAPTEPPLALRNAQSAHTRTLNVVVLNVVPATSNLENANARTDGLEALALEETDKLELPRTTLEELPVEPTSLLLILTNLPLETTNAQSAHTRTLNAVVLNVVPATDKPETANARMDGLEVLALVAMENLQTSPTEARSLNAQCAHTRRPNVVVLTVVPATNKLENANARATGKEVLAATMETSSEQDMPVPTKPTLTPLDPLPLMPLFGLLLLEFWQPSAPFSLW